MGQNRTKYGTLYGGSTQSFFSNSKFDHYRELFANMARDDNFVQVQAEGIRRVLEGTVINLTILLQFECFLNDSQGKVCLLFGIEQT